MQSGHTSHIPPYRRTYRAVHAVPGQLVADVDHLLFDGAGRLVQPAVLGVGRVDQLLQVLRLPLTLPLPGLDLTQLGQQVLLLLNLTGTGQVRGQRSEHRGVFMHSFLNLRL